MNRVRSIGSITLALGGVVGLLVVVANRGAEPIVAAQATPTPYHEGFPSPAASSEAMLPTLYPIPPPQDLASADAMAVGGAAMIQAAENMSQAAQTMIASGVPELVDRGQHWTQDAQALRERGAWMVLSATADSMVHNPDKAHELNLQNLRGNGLSMAAEGQAMADHGREMLEQVDQLSQDGAIAQELVAKLTTTGEEMVTTGEALARDGERMQEDAERLLQSIGQ